MSQVNHHNSPECGNSPENCRIISIATIQEPIIEWTPEYNGLGKMVNYDPNIFITTYTCSICSGEWQDTMGARQETKARTVIKEPNKI